MKLGQVVAGAPCDLTGLAPHCRIEQALLPGPLWGAAVLQIAGGCRSRHVGVSRTKAHRQQDMHIIILYAVQRKAMSGTASYISSETQMVQIPSSLPVNMRNL